MNSRIALIILSVAVLALVLGCSEDRETLVPAQSSGDTQTWGVLIYAAGNYGGDQLADAALSSSRAVASVRVMELEVNAPLTLTQACLATPEAAGDVGIYKVDFDPQDPEGLLNSELVADLGTVSTGDPNTLATFLRTSLSNMHADHYVLCLAGDGHGWQGMMGDYGNTLGIPVNDLREELEHVESLLPRGKFDILALYARNMGTLETVYELREYADLILTSTFNIEQPHHKIISEWYRDLQAQPELSPADLATYMVEAERLAQDTSEAVFFTTLWNTATLEPVVSSFDAFTSQWLAVSATHAPVLFSVRDRLLQSELHNGIQVDIQEYAEALLAEPELNTEEFESFRNAASELVNATLTARVNAYGSEDGNGHAGLCYYFPSQVDLDTLVGNAYADLSMAEHSQAWANYVKELPRAPVTTVSVAGIGHVRTGLTVENLVFFVDTLATGLPNPIRQLTPQWSPASALGDSAQYSISFSLTEADSLMVRFGLFVDNNQDGVLNSGDRFGFWDLPGGGNFERLMLHRGDQLTGRDVYINFTRN